jgi:hypothetical protein
LSYPQPFYDDTGQAVLTAESWQANALFLWRQEASGWTLLGPLLAGRPVVDPTLWRASDRWWLFCTFRDDGPDSRLHAFHTDRLGNPWQPHRRNPVRVDFCGSRPAGPLFVADGTLVRPGQDCSRTYGGGIVLHAVQTLNPDEFKEQPIRRLDPIDGQCGAGLHTFCPAGDRTLIDGKTWRYDPVVAYNRIASRLRRTLGAGATQACRAPTRFTHQSVI